MPGANSVDGGVVAVVDAFSTGACVAESAAKKGFEIVHVLSAPETGQMEDMVPAHLRGKLPWIAEISADESKPFAERAAPVAEALKKACGGKPLVAVLPGAEMGVEFSDALQDAVKAWAPDVRGNGLEGSHARRDKWFMGNKVRAAGVRAVRQLRVSTWPPVAAWLVAEWGLSAEAAGDDATACALVVKPLDSAGSDGVTLCKTIGDARAAVGCLVGAVNALGIKNENVLVQEWLMGDEYVVDGVSRDGKHKTVGLWIYDRRPTNGAGFVLHGQKFLGAAKAPPGMLAYANEVLDALEITEGPSHMEVKHNPETGDVCLVEVGSRCHGAEGFWMSVADECSGRNQVDASVDAAISGDAFAEVPDELPGTLSASGRTKALLIHKGGLLKGIDESVLKAITTLKSYRGHEIFVSAGDPVSPTVDLFGWGGMVKLNNPDEAALDADYKFIEAVCLAPTGGLWNITPVRRRSHGSL